MVRLAAAAVLIAVASLNEAEAAGKRLMSMREVMEQTTIESAMNLLVKKHEHHQHPRSEELVSLIQDKLIQRKGMLRSERVIGRHGSKEALGLQDTTTQPPMGYAAASSARTLLNEMVEETEDKLTIEGERCDEVNMTSLESLAQYRISIAEFNSAANYARGLVLDATGKEAKFSNERQVTGETLDSLRQECSSQKQILEQQLAIVTADWQVMNSLLNMTQCSNEPAAATNSFFQMGAQMPMSSTALVSCQHCNRGRGLVMLQDSKLQHMLNKLSSNAVRTHLNQQLLDGFQEASQRFEPVALTEVAAAHMRRLASSAAWHHSRLRREVDVNMSDANISELPEEPVPYDCELNNKCVLSEANCDVLNDRFTLVWAGLGDDRDDLQEELDELQRSCEEQENFNVEKLSFLQTSITEQETKLAEATSQQNENEVGSKVTAKQFDSLSDAYGKEMSTCCDNKNALRSEKCALFKIRGELEKLNGTSVFITDCEVSDYTPEECSTTCGGGTQLVTRSVLAHPNGGAACPALSYERKCNTQACPIDCEMEDWGGWSSCSAECGGGVRSRERPVLVPAAHGGEPCKEGTWTEACNVQACNKECVLGDWSDWTSCSKFCDRGHLLRHRGVAEAAIGTGTCPAPLALGQRLEDVPCEQRECSKLLPNWNSIFKCQDKMDVILILDGSGSVRSTGWKRTRKFAHDLIANLEGGENLVQVAMMSYSGPWSDIEKCWGSSGDLDMERDCKIRWDQRLFTSSTAEVAEQASKLPYPSGTTLTSVALAEAEVALKQGREDAESLVIVVTDGRPNNRKNTKAAARKLKKSARVLWVPVGGNAPIEMIKKLASYPEDEHVVEVGSYDFLGRPETVNKVLLAACNNVKAPEL